MNRRGVNALNAMGTQKTWQKEKTRHRERLLAAKAARGGKCERCGYDKNLAALHFHHRDPATKRFPLSTAWKMPDEDIKREIIKCNLLCGNCHTDEHWPQYRKTA